MQGRPFGRRGAYDAASAVPQPAKPRPSFLEKLGFGRRGQRPGAATSTNSRHDGASDGHWSDGDSGGDGGGGD